MALPARTALLLLALPLAAIACAEEDPLDGGPNGGTTCLTPATLLGQPCTQDFHCARGASCFSAACRTQATDGGSCETTADCADGLYCSCSRSTCKFKTGTCHKPATLQIDDACAHHKSCKSGICNAYQGNTCQDPAEAGKGCADHDQCKTGLVCHKKEQRCRLPLADGQACTERWECEDPLVCKTVQGQLVCAKAHGVRYGNCGTTHQERAETCGGKLVCIPVLGYCDLPGADGGTCGGPHSCETGLVCNGGYSTPKCQKPSVRAEGEPCTGEVGDQDMDCAAGLLCVNKRCTAPGSQAEGKDCQITAECAAPFKCPVSE